MRDYFFIIGFVFCLASCRKSELTVQEPFFKIDNISRSYLLGSDNIHAGYIPGQPDSFSFRYDNQNHFMIRVGGFLTNNYSSGNTRVFMPEIYDTVIYRNNTVELITKSSSNAFSVAPNRRVYTLSNSNIQMKVAYATSSLQQNDTTLYYYQNNKVLDKVVEKYNGYFTIKTFTFNNVGNLETVSGKTFSTADNSLLSTTEEKFGDYDNSINPLKQFGIWDETFYRSLTANNFRSYQYEKKYGTSSIVAESGNFKFNLQYNNQGVVDFTK